jgi:hypothetical protein
MFKDSIVAGHPGEGKIERYPSYRGRRFIWQTIERRRTADRTQIKQIYAD